jgi:hypothetical protein
MIPGAEQYTGLAGCWGHRHAAWVQQLGGSGGAGSVCGSLFRAPIRVPWPPGRSVEDHLVGPTGSLPVQQEAGTRTVCVACDLPPEKSRVLM